MKKAQVLALVLMTAALAVNARAAFTSGNLIVYRVGDGTVITNTGNAVFLDEYDPTAGNVDLAPVQSIPVFTNLFCAAGTSTAEGFLTRSTNGNAIVFAGYGTNRTAASISSTTASAVPRVIGRLDANGNVDISTRLPDFASGGQPRSVASTDGNSLWIAGSATSGDPQRYTTLGRTNSDPISSTVFTPRTLGIYSNQLYGSASSGSNRLYTVGSGLPTTSGQVCTNLPGFATTGSPYAFAMFNLNGGSTPDTIYVADDANITTNGAGAAIYKWSLSGGTWTSNGFVTVGTLNVRGIVGRIEAGNVRLFLAAGTGTISSGGGALFDYTDSTGFNAGPSGNGGAADPYVTFITHATSGKTFRGVAFTPEPIAAPSLTVSAGGALNTVGFAGGPFNPSNLVFTLSNTGGSSLNWTANTAVAWLDLSAVGGLITAGSSTTITASYNTAANSLVPGTYSGTIGFTNTTNGAGNTTRPVTLSTTQFGVSPATVFASAGAVGGPFAPGSQIYTLTNASATLSLTWGASKSQPWLDLSATGGTLGANSGTVVTVSINAAANSLSRGFYSDTVALTNAASDPGSTTRGVTLSVGGGFSNGNIVLYRVGDGSTAPSANGSPVFLDEYTRGGTYVQSTAVQTNNFCGAGNATSEGQISRSANGQYIIVPGYGTNSVPTGVVASSAPRVIAVVDGNGNIDTTTRLTDSTGNARGAASSDGSSLWLTSNNAGLRYAPIGATTSTQLAATPANTRGVNIFSNQLYFSSATSPYRIATFLAGGLPTTTGQTATNLYGIGTNSVVGSSYGFLMLKMSSSADPVDTLYVADDGSGGGVFKWSLVAGTWTSNGVVASSSTRGVTGDLDISGTQTNVRLYIASQTALSGFVDTNGWNKAPLGTNSFVATAPTGNSQFRGIAFTPNISVNGNLSVNPGSDYTPSGSAGGPFSPSSKVYTLANTGGGSLTWSVSKAATWLNLSATNGTLLGGANTNITVSVNATANSFAGGTYSDTINFVNTLNGDGDTTRDAILSVQQLGVTPGTTFTSRGPAGGVFSPVSAIYTLTNVSSSASLSWGASASVNWLSFSASSGTIAANGSASVTVSVNANANSLVPTVYSGSFAFTNSAASDIGNATRTAILSVGFGFCDNFSTYSSGNLVGQQGWQELSGASTLPLQVSGGKVGIPYLQTTDNQDAYKNFALTNVDVFAGIALTVTNASVSTNSSFFVALIPASDGTNTGAQVGWVNAHDVGGGQYALGLRYSNTNVNSYVFGTGLYYGTNYAVILRAAVTNDGSGSVYTNVALYVSDPAAAITTNTPYVSQFCTGPTVANLGGLNISQFASGVTTNSGQLIGRVCVNETLASVYSSLTSGGGPTDPFVTWQNTYFTPSQVANPNYGGPNADPLGKGISNTNQFLAGFDPTNSVAYPHILNVVKSGADMNVTYLGASGDSNPGGSPGPKTNVLEFTAGTGNGSYTTTNFTSTGWTNVLTGGTGQGTPVTATDTNGASGATRYYRVKVLLP